jgi:general secretion pathway protein G
MSKMRRILAGGDKGFTLIELLVVIAVLGILAAIAIPRLGGVTDKARRAEGVSFAGTLRSAQEMFYVENEEDYANNLTSLQAYFDAKAGAGDWGDWSASFSSTDSYDEDYTVTLSYSGSAGDPEDITVTPGGVD